MLWYSSCPTARLRIEYASATKTLQGSTKNVLYTLEFSVDYWPSFLLLTSKEKCNVHKTTISLLEKKMSGLRLSIICIIILSMEKNGWKVSNYYSLGNLKKLPCSDPLHKLPGASLAVSFSPSPNIFNFLN